VHPKVTAIIAIALSLLFSISPALLANVAALGVSSTINISNDSFNASYPNVQNVGNNVYVVWSESSHGIWFRSSSNSGQTFSTAVRISASGGVSQFPLMTANGSNVYVVWAQSVDNILQVYFAASANNGVSFSPAKIVDNEPNATCITPVIASYGNDVYVAYDGNGSSYVTSSTNAGATFSTPFRYGSGPEPQLAAWGTNAYAVSDSFSRTTTPLWYTDNAGNTWNKASTNGGASAEPWIAASGTDVVAAWETKSNASDVYVTSSTDSGRTWTPKFLLSSAVPDSWAPMLGIQGNDMYVAWRSNPGSDNSQEYISVSTNGGKSWPSPTAVGFAGRDNSWPTQVAVSGSNAFIMWYERTGTTSSSPWDAVVQESSNNGTTWLASPLVLGGSLGESDIATAAVSTNGAAMFAVWTNTTSTGNTQVFFATGS
jgi:hypothetical protein